MRKSVVTILGSSLLVFACATTTPNQAHRASSGDQRSRMARCSGSSAREITPRHPGQGPTDSGVELPGPGGNEESVDIGACDDNGNVAADGGGVGR